ncbi:MAG: Rad52/Rad22 family DNA repair protein [Myxococcaceae bacterium]
MTNEQKKQLYQQLSAPFPAEAIERSDAKQTGKGYSTTGIKYQYIVNRLNEVLGFGCFRAHRTVTVKETKRASGRPAYEAICDLTLELGEWVNGQFVVYAESLADGGHIASTEADARKGSFTNAFKRAAAFHGVGRHAYEGSIDEDSAETGDNEANAAPVVQVARAPAPQVSGSPVQQQPERNRLSSKQLAAIWSIARKLGIEQSGFRQQVRQKFGAQLEFLNRNQASELIGALNARLNSNGSGTKPEEQSTADGAA